MRQEKLVIQLITTEEELSKVLGSIIDEKLSKASQSTPSTEPSSIEGELLTIKQLAEFFQVSETSIHTWKNEGILPYVKIKSRIRFKKSEVLKLYEKRRNSRNR